MKEILFPENLMDSFAALSSKDDTLTRELDDKNRQNKPTQAESRLLGGCIGQGRTIFAPPEIEIQLTNTCDIYPLEILPLVNWE